MANHWSSLSKIKFYNTRSKWLQCTCKGLQPSPILYLCIYIVFSSNSSKKCRGQCRVEHTSQNYIPLLKIDIPWQDPLDVHSGMTSSSVLYNWPQLYWLAFQFGPSHLRCTEEPCTMGSYPSLGTSKEEDHSINTYAACGPTTCRN